MWSKELSPTRKKYLLSLKAVSPHVPFNSSSTGKEPSLINLVILPECIRTETGSVLRIVPE